MANASVLLSGRALTYNDPPNHILVPYSYSVKPMQTHNSDAVSVDLDGEHALRKRQEIAEGSDKENRSLPIGTGLMPLGLSPEDRSHVDTYREECMVGKVKGQYFGRNRANTSGLLSERQITHAYRKAEGK